MTEMTKAALIRTIKKCMDNGDEKTANSYYMNYKERFKITELLEELIKTDKKREKEE